MATNGLSTTFGGVEGEGFIKITVPNTQGTTARALPDQFNEECFVEAYVKQGTGYGVFYVYNPGSTTAPVRILANSSGIGTAGQNVPMLQAANSDGTINTAHNVFFIKDATTGKCSIRQNNSATAGERWENTVWIRKIG